MEFSPELKEKGIFEEYEYFNENYSQLRGIERLTIPIFGNNLFRKINFIKLFIKLR